MPGERGDRTSEYATYIRRGGQQLLDLINNILDLTALDLGRLALRREPVAIDACIAGAVEAARPQFDACGVSLVLHVAPDLPTMPADPLRLGQALDNLLSNAARFTPVGGRVDVRASLDETDCVTVSIRDTGVGMTTAQ